MLMYLFFLTRLSISEKANNNDFFANTKIYLFIPKQDINLIRKSDAEFRDEYFQPEISTKTFGPGTSEFVQTLLQQNQLYGNRTESLTTKLKYERTKVISYYRRLKNEFVCDPNGHSLANTDRLNDKYFDCKDIFQGAIGTCHFLAMTLGLTHNLELCRHIIPVDNASHANIRKGAFHFRFWILGRWYDVVIDDYLVVDCTHNILFTRNLTCLNEYWISLFEKAFTKINGKYSDVNGGFFEDGAVTISGGIYNIYYSDLVKNLTNGSFIADPQVTWIKNSLLRHYGTNVKELVPTVDELFEILRFAIKCKNNVGVFSMQVKEL